MYRRVMPCVVSGVEDIMTNAYRVTGRLALFRWHTTATSLRVFQTEDTVVDGASNIDKYRYMRGPANTQGAMLTLP